MYCTQCTVLRELADSMVFKNKISEPPILQERKTAKISGPLILLDGKTAKISGPLILQEEKSSKISGIVPSSDIFNKTSLSFVFLIFLSVR
jgi:hypothetical protein